jgi:hypothetical protein
MDPLPTFTPLDWQMLADACQAVAAKERARAEAIGGRAAGDYIASTQEFESLEQRFLKMAQP